MLYLYLQTNNQKISLKRILIIQTASLGDVILCTPIIEKLHEVYPNAKIDFLLKKGYETLLLNHPKLHHIIVWDKKENRYRKLSKLISTLRQKEYDLIINAQRYFSSGLITVLSNAQQTVGFSKNPLSIFFTHRKKHKIGTSEGNPHETERNLSLIEDFTDASNFPMKLYPTQQDFAKVSQYKTQQFITISPASLWFTKQFPKEKWVELIRNLEKHMVIYLLGSSKEVNLCNEIILESGHVNYLNLAGKLTFLESTALMKDAKMNFVNDSAPMHMASSIDAPVTAIYCSTIPEFGFGPKSSKSYIIQSSKALRCRPCGIHGHNKCPKKTFECAYTIPINQLTNLVT